MPHHIQNNLSQDYAFRTLNCCSTRTNPFSAFARKEFAHPYILFNYKWLEHHWLAALCYQEPAVMHFWGQRKLYRTGQPGWSSWCWRPFWPFLWLTSPHLPWEAWWRRHRDRRHTNSDSNPPTRCASTFKTSRRCWRSPRLGWGGLGFGWRTSRIAYIFITGWPQYRIERTMCRRNTGSYEVKGEEGFIGEAEKQVKGKKEWKI